ncbi:Zona pellucida sperm-binding protein 1, partial [Nibea albiflora]
SENESSVPLSQLPPQCGYSVQTTWRDLSLMAQYDACHVTQEDDSYVLPLLWRGTPVKMSCPTSPARPQAVTPPSPLSVCCSPYGMTVTVQGLSTEQLKINERKWTPLAVLAERCGYTLDRRDADIVIAAPFIACGITVKRFVQSSAVGYSPRSVTLYMWLSSTRTHTEKPLIFFQGEKYTLSLQIGEKTFTLACPLAPAEELPQTQQPSISSPRLPTAGSTPESLEPFPWAPPFYLAPPYYPHPTYHHQYPGPDGHDAYNPPTPSSSPPDPTSGPQPLPPLESQPDYSHQIPIRESYRHFGVHSSLSSTKEPEDSSLYPDVQQKQETPVLGLSEERGATRSPSSDAGFPNQSEAPPLQPRSHAFNQYYHYYHHPKIPHPDPPQDPDPGPEVPSLTNPHNPELLVFPPSVQQSEALSRFNSDQFLQAAPHPYTFPTSAPYPPNPPQAYPYHYFSYFPYFARGEAKRSAPLKPVTPAKTNFFDYLNTKSSTFVRPLPKTSGVHDEHTLNPFMDQPNSDKMISFQRNSQELIKHPLVLDDDEVKAELKPPAPLPEQSSLSAPTPNHNVPPYPYYYYYYYPYYNYYQMYYRPESLPGTDNPVIRPITNLKPPLHTLSSMYDVRHGPLHPYYYYYHLYNQPKVPAGDQGAQQEAGGTNSKSESRLPTESDYSEMGRLVRAAEAGYPSMPQSRAFHSLYSHDLTWQHPHPDGEDADKRLDDEMEDHLKANLYTPSASPCGLGPVSDLDCSLSSGCCSYSVKDCTMGQYLMFVVPDSVTEPTVAPAAQPSEVSNVSCTLQRLTSDPDIYTVPLDGCGVNKHVFGQTAVHLLEVHGVYSLQQDHSSVQEDSPVRLMVECSSSPGSPGEVRLYMMDQPPPPPVQSTPATVRVQLRLATDESFTSFHPEAHLPLSFVRGRPVYVELNLLDPPEPDLVLLVHSCLAYTEAPYISQMLVYDGCPSRGDSQLLPTPRSNNAHHIRRIIIATFLSLPSESPAYTANRGYSHLEDPEVFFLCLTEVCSAADGGCTVGCIDRGPTAIHTWPRDTNDHRPHRSSDLNDSGYSHLSCGDANDCRSSRTSGDRNDTDDSRHNNEH